MTRRRVVLVEDDVSIRRFVELALEELPVELVSCADLAEGRHALGQGRADVLLTDLMLPDGNGGALIEMLRARPDQGRGTHLVVFSAGLTDEVVARMAQLGVRTILRKPVSLAELERSVLAALDDPAAAGSATPGAPAASAIPTPSDHPLPSDPTPPTPPGHPDGPVDAAVARYFGGDRALYLQYRAMCAAQFEADLAEGAACTAAGDLPALRRLAHSLKSVLASLGDDAGSAVAAALERQAADDQGDAAPLGWARLAAVLQAHRQAGGRADPGSP